MVILILLLASLLGAAEPFPFGNPATTVYRYGQPYVAPQPLMALGSMPFPQLYSAVQTLQDDLQFNANQQQQPRFYQQQQPPRFVGAGVKAVQHQQQFVQQQQQPRHQQQVPIPSAPVKLGPQFQQQYLALSNRPAELQQQQQKESSIGPEGKDFLASLQIIDTSGKPRSLRDFGIGGGPSGRAYEPELEEQLLSIFSTIQQDLKGAAYLPLNLGANQAQPVRQPEPIAGNPQQHQNQLGYSFKQPAQHQFQYLKPARAAASKTAAVANQEPTRLPVQALRTEGVAKQEQQEKNIKSPAQVVRGEPEPVKRPLVPAPILAQKELVAPPRVEQKAAPVVELERKPLTFEAPVQAPEQQQQQQQQGFDDDLNDKGLEQVQLKEPIKQQREINIELVKQQAVRPVATPVNNQPRQQRYNTDVPMNGWVPLLQTFPVDQKAGFEPQQPQFLEQIREQPPALEEQKPISQLKEEKPIVGQQEEEEQQQLAKDLREEQKVDSFGDSQPQQEPQALAKSIKKGRARKVDSPAPANLQSIPPRASNIYQQRQPQQLVNVGPNFESQQQVRENLFQQQQVEQRQEEQLSAILEQQKEDMLQQQRDLAEVQKSRKQEELSLQQQRQELQAPTTTAAPVTPRPAPTRLTDGVKGGRVKLITDKTRPSPIQRMRDQQLRAQKQQQLEQSKRTRELTSAPRLPIVQRPREELVEQAKEELPRQEEVRQQKQEELLTPVLVKAPARNLGEKKKIIPSFQEQQQLQIQKQIQQQQQLQEQQLADQTPEFNEQSQQQKQEFNEQQDARPQQQEVLGQQKEELPVQNQEQSAVEQRDELNNQQGEQQQQQEEQQQKEELNQQQPQQEEQAQRKEEQQPALVQQKDEIDLQQREEPQQQKEDQQQQQQQQQQQEGFSEQPAVGPRDEVSQQQQQKEEVNQQREELDQQKEDQQTQKPTEAASQQQEEETVQLKEDQAKQEQQQQQSAGKLEEGPSSQRSEATTTSTTTTSTTTTTTGSTTTEIGSSQQPIELTSQQEQKQEQRQEEVEKKVEEQQVTQTFGQDQQQQRGELTTIKSSQLIDEEPTPILTTTQRPPTRIRPGFFKKLEGDRFGKQKSVFSQEKKEDVQPDVTISTTLRPKGRIIKGRRQQAQQQSEGQKRGPARNWTTYSTRPRSNENFQPQERDNNEGILSANQLLNTYNPLQFEPERISSLNNRATESSPQNTNVNSSPSGESY